MYIYIYIAYMCSKTETIFKSLNHCFATGTCEASSKLPSVSVPICSARRCRQGRRPPRRRPGTGDGRVLISSMSKAFGTQKIGTTTCGLVVYALMDLDGS